MSTVRGEKVEGGEKRESGEERGRHRPDLGPCGPWEGFGLHPRALKSHWRVLSRVAHGQI